MVNLTIFSCVVDFVFKSVVYKDDLLYPGGLAVWRFRPILEADFRFQSYLLSLWFRRYLAVAVNHNLINSAVFSYDVFDGVILKKSQD